MMQEELYFTNNLFQQSFNLVQICLYFFFFLSCGPTIDGVTAWHDVSGNLIIYFLHVYVAHVEI